MVVVMVVVLPVDLHIGKIGPVRALETVAVAEVGEFQPHRVVGVRLKLDATDFDHRPNTP